MNTGRRTFLSGIAATLVAVRPAFPAGQRNSNPPMHGPQIPDASGTSGVDNSPLASRVDPRRVLKEQQKELRRDVDRLLQMAKDLKDESDKTPETDVLSLSLVKKAEDIEKLARQIKEKIRSR